MYPSQPLKLVGYAAIIAEDVAWSVVSSPDRTTTSFEGELQWLSPDEIRFFAAASLAEAHPRTNGRVRIHAGDFVGILELDEAEAEDPNLFVERSRTFFHDHCQDLSSLRVPFEPNGRWHLLDRDYNEELVAVFDAMDFGDPLLHRGLSKLLTATELIGHSRKFLEEAGLAAFISREAVLELLRRKLSARQGGRAKREDVLNWIRSEFPTGQPFVEVLESDWEARVMMVHPVSESGEFWTPPVFADECYDAVHTLTYLYRFLLLDEPWTPVDCD